MESDLYLTAVGLAVDLEFAVELVADQRLLLESAVAACCHDSAVAKKDAAAFLVDEASFVAAAAAFVDVVQQTDCVDCARV